MLIRNMGVHWKGGGVDIPLINLMIPLPSRKYFGELKLFIINNMTCTY